MRFVLVDRIEALEPGRRIVAVKNLTLGEEYLQDHFPTFPVMPGVLMLEALVQAGAWLWRISTNFSHSVVVLREAKGIKYGNFVEPGRQLVLTVEAVDNLDENAQIATFKGNGEIGGTSAVSARFTLTRYNLRERFPNLAPLDEELLADWRRRHMALTPLAPPVGQRG
ncbi:MAG: beta-hydroxyacyl-ACP dehydratase [Gemmatales bacterium]|nr:beta-hydroxyacyl-ACP dehydratase [Gemmatales bacterium]MDW8386359.1 3-hydroxyacyl-ACP dehydratase FabZ family protein [Gemmatales bacterium]